MKKEIIGSILIIFLLIMFTGCHFNKKDSNNQNNNMNNTQEDNIKEDNSNNSNEVISSMKIIINNKEFKLNLEDNSTTREFVNLLPLNVDMNELNGNEKYAYLTKSLPTNSYSPKHINKGDVMLYGDNCLVIFYESFDTPYSYTKIGHIDHLDILGKESITVKIEKLN